MADNNKTKKNGDSAKKNGGSQKGGKNAKNSAKGGGGKSSANKTPQKQKGDEKKKADSGGKSPALKKLEETVNRQNKNMSVVLFALGFTFLLMVLIKGTDGWRAFHNFFLGLFGFSALFVPVILMYTAVNIGREKSSENITGRALFGVAMIFLLSAFIQIFISGTIPGDSFKETMSAMFSQGKSLKGGGVASLLIAGPLLSIFGSIGAKIITIIMIFVVLSLLKGMGIIQFFDWISKPFKAFGKYVTGFRMVMMGEDFQDAFTDDYEPDEETEEAEKRSFHADIEAFEMINNRDESAELPPEESPPPPEQHVREKIISTEKNGDFTIDIPLPYETERKTKKPPETPYEEKIISGIPTGEIENVYPDENLERLIERAVYKKRNPDSDFTTTRKKSRSKLYILPSVELLTPPDTYSGSEEAIAEMREKADIIQTTLQNFNVEVTIKNIFRGPSITRYEIQPAAGVKVSKIRSLEDDIALSLAARGVRIEAPVPGKSVIGIEVPNEHKDIVTMREMLSSPEFRNSKSRLTFAVGKDIAGNIILGDIAKMPHVIIAGTTGSGKSVCTRSIIMSIMYNASPEQVKFILIDPKIVEFKVFEGIPHLLIPIVTDAKKAAGALGWAVSEMMRRYQTFADASVNDLKSYNQLAEEEDDMSPIPQIVIFIDELADMMLVAGKEVEESICRLAQMGRAAGIHLVVATQRPTTDVITGLIKANIPSRIALSVMSQVDSRTIIDQSGADKLLGNGDMLYLPIGSSDPLRVQGCFASNEDINSTLDFIKSQSESEYDLDIIEAVENFIPVGKGEKDVSHSTGFETGTDEDYVERAIEVAVNAGQISTSMLQRKLKLGYARAARIIDTLEEMGVVGASEGSKPRKVLMSRMQYENRRKTAKSKS